VHRDLGFIWLGVLLTACSGGAKLSNPASGDAPSGADASDEGGARASGARTGEGDEASSGANADAGLDAGPGRPAVRVSSIAAALAAHPAVLAVEGLLANGATCVPSVALDLTITARPIPKDARIDGAPRIDGYDVAFAANRVPSTGGARIELRVDYPEGVGADDVLRRFVPAVKIAYVDRIRAVCPRTAIEAAAPRFLSAFGGSYGTSASNAEVDGEIALIEKQPAAFREIRSGCEGPIGLQPRITLRTELSGFDMVPERTYEASTSNGKSTDGNDAVIPYLLHLPTERYERVVSIELPALREVTRRETTSRCRAPMLLDPVIDTGALVSIATTTSEVREPALAVLADSTVLPVISTTFTRLRAGALSD
jgi:hypothetical protein